MGNRKEPTFENVHIEGFEKGITMPADAPASFDGLLIKGCKIAIELRDPPSLLEKIGLPKDTPPEFLLEAIKIIENSDSSSPKKVEDLLQRSKLFEWLGASANIATISTALFQLMQGDALSAVVSLFSDQTP